MRIRALCGLACVLLLAGSATAAVPQTFSYQGRLTTDGQPVADGAWDLVFSIYAVDAGGSPLWTETQSDVVVKNGLFTVRLGSATPLPADLFTTSPRYLGFAVEGSPEAAPRTPIVSVPYALVAGKVSGDPTNCHTCDTVFINNVGPEVFRASVDTALKVVDTGAAARVGFNSRIQATTSDTISAIRGVADNTGTGRSIAGQFVASGSSGSARGIHAQATNNSLHVSSIGVVGQGQNDGAGEARGGHFEAKSPGDGEHVGVAGQSYHSGSGKGYGVKGLSTHTGIGDSYGGLFSAEGGKNRFGVYGLASANSSDTSIGAFGTARNTSSGPAFGGYFSADTLGSGSKFGLFARVWGGTATATGTFGSVTSYATNHSGTGVAGHGNNYSSGKGIGGDFHGYSQDGTGYGATFYGASTFKKAYGLYTVAAVSGGTDTTFGAYSKATGDILTSYAGPSFAGYFLNTVPSGGTTIGLYSLVDGTNSASAGYGTYSRTQHDGSGTSYAGYFLADSSGTGTSYGVRPVALSKGTAAAYGVSCAVANRGTGSVYAGFFDVLNYGTGSRYAVYGSSPVSGYAGYFNGDVRVTGDQTVLGAKSAAVEVAPEEYRLVYSQESPECWFEDFGEGQLINGRVHIDLDPGFLQTVTINQQNPIKVFVQLNDPDCNGTAVVRGTTGFDVVELLNGRGSASFSYRVVAKRKGYESVRLAKMEGDTPGQVAAHVESSSQGVQTDEAQMERAHLLQKQNRQKHAEEDELMERQNQP